MNRSRATATIAVAIVGLLALAGCASNAVAQAGESSDDGESVILIDSQASEAQSKALSDGVVDRDEYVAGFSAYEQCLKEAGFTLTHYDLDATILDYAVPDTAVRAGVDEPCYRQNFALIDESWQIANFGASETAAFLRACLESAGITPSEDATQLDQQVREELKISPADCQAQ